MTFRYYDELNQFKFCFIYYKLNLVKVNNSSFFTLASGILARNWSLMCCPSTRVWARSSNASESNNITSRGYTVNGSHILKATFRNLRTVTNLRHF